MTNQALKYDGLRRSPKCCPTPADVAAAEAAWIALKAVHQIYDRAGLDGVQAVLDALTETGVVFSTPDVPMFTHQMTSENVPTLIWIAGRKLQSIAILAARQAGTTR